MRSTASRVIGLSSAMVGALALLFVADHLFFKLSPLALMGSVFSYRKTSLSGFMTSGYADWIWGLLAVGTGLSITLAWRKGGRRSSLAINVTVLVALLVFAYVANSAAKDAWRQ